jgi:hypothetical protein
MGTNLGTFPLLTVLKNHEQKVNANRRDRKTFINTRAQFYIGLAQAQIGDFKKAVGIWRNLEKNGPADAPWMAMVKKHIAAYAKEGGFDPESVQPAPPS